MQSKHRRFVLLRETDDTGFSGTGAVAEGIRWGDGTVAVRWLSEHASTVVWPDLDSALAVHGHDGSTRLEWVEEPVTEPHLPEVIRLERAGSTFTLTIDGVEFPWYVGADSVSTVVRRDDMPSVGVELPCTRLEIVDAMSGGEA
jgi:L-alanine-DL-glutamate epimerase-like enolase superfamily enzyme